MSSAVENSSENQGETRRNTNSSRGQNNRSRGSAGNGSNRGRGGGARRGGGSARSGGAPVKHEVDMRQYEKMMTAAHNNFSDIKSSTNTQDCAICYKPNDVFGVGPCRHPVCAECAIRMRVLGDSKTCPVCRADIDILSFCTTDEDFANVNLDSFPQTQHPDEKRFGIRFNNSTSGSKYEKYLAHVCKICKAEDGERLEFPSFMSLRQHMASKHDLTYCHICTDNLSLFSRERKTYTRDQHTRHMRIGDYDDKSFKGHPQCFFCEQKFLDEENRYRHLRKDHFFCQFCEAEGTMTNVFFGKHEELIYHYKENHFICEISECKTMGIAFANKFELDLHKANEHSMRGNLMDLGFGGRQVHLGGSAPSTRGGRGGRGRGGPTGPQPSGPPGRPGERIALVTRQEVQNPQTAPSEFTTVPSAQSKSTGIRPNQRPAYTPQTHEFPSLGPERAPPPPPIRSSEFPRLNKVNKTMPTPAPIVEEFPSLGGGSSSNTTAPLRMSVPPPMVKKRVPPPNPPPPQQKKQQQKGKNARRNEEDEEDYVENSRRDVPQAVIKVNNSLLRFDMVDDRAAPAAKSNIQMIQRSDLAQNSASTAQKSKPAASSAHFPSLPTASAPMEPANSKWAASKLSKVKSGAISSVTVPANYSAITKNQATAKKNKVKTPKTEVWSSLGPAPTSVVVAPQVDEWQDVPLSKEAQAEKEKKERKEEWARKKAEQKEAKAVERGGSSEEDKKKEEDWAKRKAEIQKAIANSGKSKAVESERSSTESETWQDVKPKNEPEVKKNDKKKNKQEKKEVEPEMPVKEEDPTGSLQEALQNFLNMPPLPSISSVFGGFSLGGLLGNGTPTTSVVAPPPGIAPPPGLENVKVSPPPGINFASVPFFTDKELAEKKELAENAKKQVEMQSDDGWTHTAPKKTNNKQKNKKK